MDVKDPYRCAKILIDQYGSNAEGYAEQRMQAMMHRNDAKGSACWLAIENAIRDLRRMSSSNIH